MYQPVFLSALFLHTSTDCSHFFQCCHISMVKSSAKENFNIHSTENMTNTTSPVSGQMGVHQTQTLCVFTFVLLFFLTWRLMTTSCCNCVFQRSCGDRLCLSLRTGYCAVAANQCVDRVIWEQARKAPKVIDVRFGSAVMEVSLLSSQVCVGLLIVVRS